MRARGKRRPGDAAPWRSRALAGLLLFVALWPILHRVLVARYELNPWRLGGFAMYSTYVKTIVALAEPTEGGLRPLAEASLDPESLAVLERFRQDRSVLGRLRPPHDVARAVFRERPELRRLVVVVQRLALDPESARMVSGRRSIHYDRDVLFSEGGASGELELP